MIRLWPLALLLATLCMVWRVSQAFMPQCLPGLVSRRALDRRRTGVKRPSGKGFGPAKPSNGNSNSNSNNNNQGAKPKAAAAGPKVNWGGDESCTAEILPDVKKPAIDTNAKLQMLYTCKICETRNLITMNRVAFYEGIVVARCKTCDSKHLVADNISKLDFAGGRLTLDQIMASKGEDVTRIDLSSSPDLSKYNLQYKDDGTVEMVPK